KPHQTLTNFSPQSLLQQKQSDISFNLFMCFIYMFRFLCHILKILVIIPALIYRISLALFNIWKLFLVFLQLLIISCLFLAHTSATFGALTLPMMCLGLLDYCIEDTNIGRQSTFCKFLRNMVLTLLVWTQAVIYSLKESTLVPYFILGLFTTVFFTMLPFCSRITQWVKEADRISELREEQENQGSDLFISTPSTETKSSKEYYLETTQPRPPLWFSLTLGFTTIWMPYLIVSVACLVLGYGVPAYISVNLLWLECTNSLLVVVVLWLKSKWLGPYSQLPENDIPEPGNPINHFEFCVTDFIHCTHLL
uniref:Uncharacterized protein n=1 Tax=Seriola dumerili TaxID=41447 RepID=A0A3B4VDH0_SERDU